MDSSDLTKGPTVAHQLSAKFNDYRSRVMLGELPTDFLRIEFFEPSANLPQFHPDFIGHLTMTIAEARLIKNAGPLGLLRMDPYVRFQLGHLMHETPTASGGGKNPQWKVSYRINLYKGMNRMHLEVYDQRSFTEDSFIGECDIVIPEEVNNGETYQHWYPLMGRESNASENQGDILIIMSLMKNLSDNPNFPNEVTRSSSSSSTTSQSNSISESTPTYSVDDVRTIEEMFPTVDRQLIVNLLDKHSGNKDLTVNELLQTNGS